MRTNRISTYALLLLAWPFLLGSPLFAAENQPKLLDVRKIADTAHHSAFTDLIRHNDRFICVFREGKAHVSPDGAIRILTSTDGKKWESAALLTSDKADLRDPKISVMPDGKLLLLVGIALPVKPEDKSAVTHRTWVYTSFDGRNGTAPRPSPMTTTGSGALPGTKARPTVPAIPPPKTPRARAAIPQPMAPR